jgi:hypothetical protein
LVAVQVADVFLFAFDAPATYVDISSVIDLKVSKCWRTGASGPAHARGRSGFSVAVTRMVFVGVFDPHPPLQISALLKHESQYSNATDVAQGVQSLAAYIAQQVNATAPAWYAEGFTHIPQMG